MASGNLARRRLAIVSVAAQPPLNDRDSDAGLGRSGTAESPDRAMVGLEGRGQSSTMHRAVAASVLGVVIGLVGGAPAHAAANSCTAVKSSGLLQTIHAKKASAVKADSRRWFVSTATGASWLTTQNPAKDSSGLTLPLNPKARAASDIGVDARPGVPAYAGHTDGDAGAVASRACAKAQG